MTNFVFIWSHLQAVLEGCQVSWLQADCSMLSAIS
jgi:hypothetical protein